MLEKREAHARRRVGQGGDRTGDETVCQLYSTTVTVPCQGSYRLPNVHYSEADARRWCHADLPEMTDFDLWREAERVKAALVWTDNLGARAWLQERWKAVRSQQEARRE